MVQRDLPAGNAALRSDREREERASEGSARFYKPKSDSDDDFQRKRNARAESGEKGKSESALHLAFGKFMQSRGRNPSQFIGDSLGKLPIKTSTPIPTKREPKM